ncbi:MAG: hypothetical protein BWY80_00763 [Firmicutes bacterium ADurb.Bin456]|nr:MAG: hypothetical protein BWY80_00763 [Firmicutes bacterium ADurb.Bin456]
MALNNLRDLNPGTQHGQIQHAEPLLKGVVVDKAHGQINAVVVF